MFCALPAIKWFDDLVQLRGKKFRKFTVFRFITAKAHENNVLNSKL